MILDEEIYYTTNSRNCKYYREKGYIFKCGDTIKIKTKDLQSNSTHRIDVLCDRCKNFRNIRYQDYLKVLKNNDGKYYCSSCKFIIYANKQGVDNISQLQNIKNKKIETSIRNWGVENPSQSKIIKKRKEETSLINYGTEYHLQSVKGFNNFFKKIDKIKEYKETDLYYQCKYEYDFLEHCENDKILHLISNFNYHLKYKYNENIKNYHPDFYIKDLNLIIEIKSNYTFNQHFLKNLLKQQSCIDGGYDFIFIIDKNYTEFDNIIKNEYKF